VARPPEASRPSVAITLASIGGLVDAVGFLTLFGLFTAHLSGNTARLGIDLGQAELAAALTYAVPVVAFFGAVLAGARFCNAGDARRWNTLRTLLAIELALLASFMVVATAVRDHGDLTPHSGAYYLLAVVAVTAMGLQTASLRQVAGCRCTRRSSPAWSCPSPRTSPARSATRTPTRRAALGSTARSSARTSWAR